MELKNKLKKILKINSFIILMVLIPVFIFLTFFHVNFNSNNLKNSLNRDITASSAAGNTPTINQNLPQTTSAIKLDNENINIFSKFYEKSKQSDFSTIKNIYKIIGEPSLNNQKILDENENENFELFRKLKQYDEKNAGGWVFSISSSDFDNFNIQDFKFLLEFKNISSLELIQESTSSQEFFYNSISDLSWIGNFKLLTSIKIKNPFLTNYKNFSINDMLWLRENSNLKFVDLSEICKSNFEDNSAIWFKSLKKDSTVVLDKNDFRLTTNNHDYSTSNDDTNGKVILKKLFENSLSKPSYDFNTIKIDNQKYQAKIIKGTWFWDSTSSDTDISNDIFSKINYRKSFDEYFTINASNDPQLTRISQYLRDSNETSAFSQKYLTKQAINYQFSTPQFSTINDLFQKAILVDQKTVNVAMKNNKFFYDFDFSSLKFRDENSTMFWTDAVLVPESFKNKAISIDENLFQNFVHTLLKTEIDKPTSSTESVKIDGKIFHSIWSSSKKAFEWDFSWNSFDEKKIIFWNNLKKEGFTSVKSLIENFQSRINNSENFETFLGEYESIKYSSTTISENFDENVKNPGSIYLNNYDKNLDIWNSKIIIDEKEYGVTLRNSTFYWDYDITKIIYSSIDSQNKVHYFTNFSSIPSHLQASVKTLNLNSENSQLPSKKIITKPSFEKGLLDSLVVDGTSISPIWIGNSLHWNFSLLSGKNINISSIKYVDENNNYYTKEFDEIFSNYKDNVLAFPKGFTRVYAEENENISYTIGSNKLITITEIDENNFRTILEFETILIDEKVYRRKIQDSKIYWSDNVQNIRLELVNPDKPNDISSAFFSNVPSEIYSYSVSQIQSITNFNSESNLKEIEKMPSPTSETDFMVIHSNGKKINIIAGYDKSTGKLVWLDPSQLIEKVKFVNIEFSSNKEVSREYYVDIVESDFQQNHQLHLYDVIPSSEIVKQYTTPSTKNDSIFENYKSIFIFSGIFFVAIASTPIGIIIQKKIKKKNKK